MDEPPHQRPDGHDDEAARDALDQSVRPLLGLSAGTLAAIFVCSRSG